MKTSKTVIESIAVAALAMALTITAVTGNGVSISTDAETQIKTNGIAGVAVVMNEYNQEVADMLEEVVSVERTDTSLVTASTAETVSEEEQKWQDKLMAKVDNFLYVRAKADADSKIVGKMYKGDRAVIKKVGKTWTKIASGNVVGYVKNEYCVTGTDALEYAQKHCDTVAKVNIDGLRVRKSASTDGAVVKAVASGEALVVDTKADAPEGWVAVKVNSDTCYVSEEYVTVSLQTGKAVTLDEEAAALKAEEAKKAAEAAANTKTAEASGQTSSSGTTQGTSLAATADEETLLAAIIQCEAGGQSMECMTAVGAVVVNRVHSGSFPNTIYGVLYQNGQFGPASSGRLASRISSGVSSRARQAAQAALSGSDPTGGAKYFKLASSGHEGVVIGAIVFY
jgi:spore germination cell wall hydrolase CwlJ-like protein